MSDSPSDPHRPLGQRLATWLFRLPAVQQLWSRRYRALALEGVPWTPVERPVHTYRVALVTSGGVHLAGDRPFDMSDPQGDPSYRVIPADTPTDALAITHDYYDHRAADRDMNVVFPLDVMRSLQAEGRLGPMAPRAYSLMGHIEGPHLDTLRSRTAPEVAQRLADDGAEIALFTPS